MKGSTADLSPITKCCHYYKKFPVYHLKLVALNLAGKENQNILISALKDRIFANAVLVA